MGRELLNVSCEIAAGKKCPQKKAGAPPEGGAPAHDWRSSAPTVPAAEVAPVAEAEAVDRAEAADPAAVVAATAAEEDPAAPAAEVVAADPVAAVVAMAAKVAAVAAAAVAAVEEDLRPPRSAQAAPARSIASFRTRASCRRKISATSTYCRRPEPRRAR